MNRHFYETSHLDAILPDDQDLLELWMKIFVNLYSNDKAADFALKQNYLIFWHAMAFISKCDYPGFLMEAG